MSTDHVHLLAEATRHMPLGVLDSVADSVGIGGGTFSGEWGASGEAGAGARGAAFPAAAAVRKL